MNFRDDLDDELHSLPVRETSLDAIITTARVRTRRRRISVSTLAAAVVIVSGAFGFRQLATDHSTENAAPPVAPSLPGQPGLDPDELTDYGVDRVEIPGAKRARAADANVSWKVLDPESDAAKNYRFGSARTYALANVNALDATGSLTSEQRLYKRTPNGWTRELVERLPNFRLILSNDVLYGITEPDLTQFIWPRGKFGRYDFEAGSWRLHDVPTPIRTYRSDLVEVYATYQTMPITGGVLVVATVGNPILNTQKLPELANEFSEAWVQGGKIKNYTDCDKDAVQRGIDDGTVPSADLDAYNAMLAQNCTLRVLDPVSLGLSPEDIVALGPRKSLSFWKMTYDTMSPIDTGSALIDASEATLAGNILTVQRFDYTTSRFRVAADASLTPAFADLSANTTWVGISNADSKTNVLAIEKYVLRQKLGSTTQATDLTPALTGPNRLDPQVNLTHIVQAESLTVATGNVLYSNPPTTTARVTDRTAGYSLVIANGDVTVVNDRTGKTLKVGDIARGDEYVLVPASGETQLLPLESVGVTGSEAPTPIATFDIDPTTVPGVGIVDEQVVVTSSDGINYATTLVGDLVGSDSDILTLGDPTVSATGQVLIDVFNSTTDKHSLLVGTPKP